MNTIKRSVVFPNDLRDLIQKEADRRGISFNRLVEEACIEKVSPDYYRDSIEGLREEMDLSGYSKEALSTTKEIKLRLKGEDVIRLKRLAREAKLTVTELIRRFARYGKIVINEVKIPGVLEWNEEALPLMENLNYLIERAETVTVDDRLAVEIKSVSDELLVRLTRLRKDFFYTKRRINRRLNKKGE